MAGHKRGNIHTFATYIPLNFPLSSPKIPISGALSSKFYGHNAAGHGVHVFYILQDRPVISFRQTTVQRRLCGLTFLLHDGRIWVYDATATYYALQLDWYRTWIGDIFLASGLALSVPLTRTVLLWEFWGFIFTLSPGMLPALQGLKYSQAAFSLDRSAEASGRVWLCQHALGLWSVYDSGTVHMDWYHGADTRSLYSHLIGDNLTGTAGCLCMIPPCFWDTLVLPRLSTRSRLQVCWRISLKQAIWGSGKWQVDD